MTLLWLRIAVLLYGVAALAVLPAALYNRPRWRHIAMPAALTAVFFHFVALAEMLNAAHHALPVERTSRSRCWGCFWRSFLSSRPLPYGLVRHLSAAGSGAADARAGVSSGAEVLDYPLLHTGWLFLHVALLLAAYAALLISLMASVLYLMQERRLKQKARARALCAVAAAGDDRPDCAEDAAVWIAVHDCRDC